MSQPKTVYSEFYDSVRQRRLSDSINDNLLRQTFVGRLRFDWLLNGGILLDEFQFFDGAAFQTSLKYLLKKSIPVAHNLPRAITVVTSYKSIEESILNFALDNGKDKYFGFVFSSIKSPTERSQFRKYLVSNPPKKINSMVNLCDQMRSAGVCNENVDIIQSFWHFAQELPMTHPDFFRFINKTSPIHYKEGFMVEPICDLKQKLKTDNAKFLVNKFSQLIGLRGLAMEQFSELSSQSMDANSRSEIDMIMRWFQRSHHRSIAHSLGVNCELLEPGSVGVLQEGENISAIRVCNNFFQKLANLPLDQFEATLQSDIKSWIRWWNKQDSKALESALLGMSRTLEEQKLYLSAKSESYVKIIGNIVGKGKTLIQPIAIILGENLGQSFGLPPSTGSIASGIASWGVAEFSEKLANNITKRLSNHRKWTHDVLEIVKGVE